MTTPDPFGVRAPWRRPFSGWLAPTAVWRYSAFTHTGYNQRKGSTPIHRPDDSEFEEIYQSLTPGLVIAACSAESGYSAETLRSFCFSLKGGAIRCGSDVMLYSVGGGPIDWGDVGVQIQEHGARGIRVFVINRFDDPSLAGIMSRTKQDLLWDRLDGSIHPDIAGHLQQGALGSKCTIMVTTIAGTDDQIRDRRIARMLGKEQGVFIALDHDIEDSWYGATVTTGATERKYGPLDFVSECPQPPKAQPQPESGAELESGAEPSTEAPSQRRPSWLRRLFG